MNLIQKRSTVSAFNKYILGMLTVLAAGYGAYFLVSTFFTSPQNSINNHARQTTELGISVSPPLINNGGGWWESNSLIYHGIPTRILFFLPPGNNLQPTAVNEAAWQEFERIGRIFNPFSPTSEIARLNATPWPRHPPLRLIVSKDIYTVMIMSREIWNQSSGNFDPTLWPVKQLWQNAEKIQKVPPGQDIDTALRSMGFGKVRLIDDQRYTIEIEDHPVMFDFGGIVKGYAVDQVRKILLEKGVAAGLVQLGGEVSPFGNNEGGNPWRIGVQHPKQMDKVWGVIEAQGSLRVSTSGNYRQPIMIKGQSFYHIFSPKTGLPVSEKVLGVTTACIGENTSNARLDGVATAITVMGPSAGLQLAEKLRIEALVLFETDDGTIGELTTKGFGSHYKREDR
ncbi:MAG: FAD:protein FMN transferase [Desulfobacteraceae bacterium]|nr:MAG: FAD:protein FMN transferase [Desulfobacteraceae bacterium]